MALVLATPLAASPARAQAQSDRMAALDALGGTHDPLAQLHLLDLMCRSGAKDSAVMSAAPPVLLGLLRDASVEWSVRGTAMSCLRRLDAPDDILAQAIEAAGRDQGPHAGFLQAQAIAMQKWRDARADSRGAPAMSDAEAARRARFRLKERNIDVSLQALADALGAGESGTVAALLTAGLRVGGPDGPAAVRRVVDGVTSACVRKPPPVAGLGEGLSFLVGHGLPLEWRDETGNTLLVAIVQFCPAPVIAKLLALGASPDPVNKQHFTPLQTALVQGKWDVAQVLVDAGARITRAEADQLFFQPPTEQSQRDLLDRATQQPKRGDP